MNPLHLLSASEQVAEHLRIEMVRGTLFGDLPGIHQLAAELAVNHKTVVAALHQLEGEGLLVSQGKGKGRKIVKPTDQDTAQLRIGLLLYDSDSYRLDYIVELIHTLTESGHVPVIPGKSLWSLGMSVSKVSQLVDSIEADAWIVGSGSSEVLEWFAEQSAPVFALFGRRYHLPIASAGPDKSSALIDSVQRLVELGHQRIVMLTHQERRLPTPGLLERTFLSSLKESNIQAGPYNLPDWEDSTSGLHDCLDSLFQHTPPTALLVDTPPLFISVQQHLAQKGLVAPRDVSLVCLDQDPSFAWCNPSIAHIRWNPSQTIHRVTRWADHISHHKEDRQRTFSKANFVDGGTVGPVRKKALNK